MDPNPFNEDVNSFNNLCEPNGIFFKDISQKNDSC